MTVQFWITTTAIVVGPILAVLAARYLDLQREAKSRRMEVFRSLMRTRRAPLHPDHVAAINLVEIEFNGRRRVLEAFSELMKHFSRDYVRRDGEDEGGYVLRTQNSHGEHLTRLLDEMSKDLGYRHEQLEILRGGYHPEGHGTLEIEQAKARRLLANLHDLSRGRGLPIDVVDYRTPEQIRAGMHWIDQKLGGQDNS